jgi:hypothetical protein
MVEVFKTNVQREKEAELLLEKLQEQFPQYKINFDLADCDKILRVEGKQIQPQNIISIMEKSSYNCEVLV